MKYILTIIAALSVALSGAYAACGKKVDNVGTLKSYDETSKEIVVETDGKEAKITLTPDTETKDKDGKEIKIDDLIGKEVKVVSEHKKADSVTEKAEA
ncbi:hypothetical protein BH23VER1_BH23VER1_34170 [soil metagenome]